MKPLEAIVDRQIKRWELEKRLPKETEEAPVKPGPIITISRQRGSGGSIIAERLADLTGFTVINREIIDQISREIGTQKRLIESLDESVRSNFELWVDGLLRGHIVDNSDYVQKLVKIIGVITHHGKAIIVGRGANFIVGAKSGFHVRIIADYESRIKSLMDRRGYSQEQAKEDIENTDQQRKKFIKNHFSKDIDDPAVYDMILNGTFLDVDKMTGIILNSYPQKNYL